MKPKEKLAEASRIFQQTVEIKNRKGISAIQFQCLKEEFGPRLLLPYPSIIPDFFQRKAT